ncbi:MAG TPA: 8-oxoguanine DNA glycosylase [Candidatus Limivivens intestinipullorum]|uniref:DNA-(apurinic or apyrimidinic site) lyase n=1 Tax=Candidatus Limivivens intestinipullorum TaxID=2840858 RepID=A0A9D1JKR3_9FIRM|nr:8-oxoguanine DNA glycosylase [Candidatus Limivivens intestinipullorum]
MITIKKKCFSIGQICESGQCFRLTRTGEGRYELIALGNRLVIEEEGESVRLFCSEDVFADRWRAYFDLDTSYEEVLSRIDPDDGFLVRAARFGGGIRILKQDVWEMIITFILSQQNNIPRIRRLVRTVCEHYGEAKKDRDGTAYYAFPTAEALAKASEEELRSLKLGYRSRYIRETAASIAAGEVDLEGIKSLSYEEARRELLTLSGIGQKVADCICLFGLHHLAAFPMDTHILQILKREYPDGFPFARYRDCAGIMQQYLFYYEVNAKKE